MASAPFPVPLNRKYSNYSTENKTLLSLTKLKKVKIKIKCGTGLGRASSLILIGLPFYPEIIQNPI